MQKKLTITIAEEVYEGLYEVVGPRRRWPINLPHSASYAWLAVEES